MASASGRSPPRQEGRGVRLVGTKKLKPGRKPRARRSQDTARGGRGAPTPRHRPPAARSARQEAIHLEKLMAPDAESGDVAQSAAHAERDARTLSGLARLYAKLVELASGKGKPDQDKSVKRPEATTMRTDSAAILRSAFSDSIRLCTRAFSFGLARGRAATPALRLPALGARRSIAAGAWEADRGLPG
jgi:hypothetical protein